MKRLVLLAFLLVAVAGLSACSHKNNNAVARDAKITNAYSQRLEAAVPYPLPQIHDSVERRNLRERLLRFNKPDKIGYVYVLGLNGNVIGYYTIKGKVSSTDSQMTASQQIVRVCGSCDTREVVTTMGDDGSYGANEQGVFFFTTNGVLVETSMQYIYSDSPLPVHAPSLNPAVGQKPVSDLGRK